MDLAVFTDHKVVRYFINDNSESISSAPWIVHFFMIWMHLWMILKMQEYVLYTQSVPKAYLE